MAAAAPPRPATLPPPLARRSQFHERCRSPRRSSADYGLLFFFLRVTTVYLGEDFPDAGAWRVWLPSPTPTPTPRLPHSPDTTDWISAVEVSKKFHFLSVRHIYSCSSKNFVLITFISSLIIAIPIVLLENFHWCCCIYILSWLPWSVQHIRKYYHLFNCGQNSAVTS
jgi:hypothetical protein